MNQRVKLDGCEDFAAQLDDALDNDRLWRGFGKKVIQPGSLMHARLDREPKHNSKVVHRVADNWFFEKFGRRYRSQAYFCTGAQDVAKHYGNVYEVFPLNGFNFCWSPKIRDLFTEVSLSFIDPCDTPAIIDLLERGDYREVGLTDAIRSGCEIMVCAPGFRIV